jgi:hypothetical protein
MDGYGIEIPEAPFENIMNFLRESVCSYLNNQAEFT